MSPRDASERRIEAQETQQRPAVPGPWSHEQPPAPPSTGPGAVPPYAPWTAEHMTSYGQQPQEPAPPASSVAPSGPAQTPIPQPYGPHAPAGVPAAQPANIPDRRRKKPRRLWLTCGIIAAIFFVLCVAVGGLVGYAAVQAAQPLKAAQLFCQDVQRQDYSAAYGMLSTSYKATVSDSQFTQIGKLQDQIDGKVTACGLAQNASGLSITFNPNQSQATFDVRVSRNRQLTGTVTMVKENGAWKVDQVSQSVQGTDVRPLLVADQFCRAIVAQDFPTAYGLLSPALQAKASEQQFQAAFSNESNVTIAGCSPSLGTYTVSARGSTATLQTTLQVTVNSANGASATEVPVSLAFTKFANVWKIDAFDIRQS